jgi:hypothetical protein
MIQKGSVISEANAAGIAVVALDAQGRIPA